MNTIMRIVAIICNFALLGFICWALVSQPSHPQEEGFVAFVLVSVLTPILSVVVLFGSMKRKMKVQQRTMAHQQ